jgi:NADPH:quinone reductase-like Zn-dependent oxidoreductase
VDYTRQDFVEEVRAATGGSGADVVLDVVGAPYLSRNVDLLATGGRLVLIGLQGGARAEIDLGAVLAKRLSVLGSTLRARPLADKAAICASVVEHVWPLLAEGRVRPVVHERVPMAEAARAHRAVEASEHVGKVLLVVG